VVWFIYIFQMYWNIVAQTLLEQITTLQNWLYTVISKLQHHTYRSFQILPMDNMPKLALVIIFYSFHHKTLPNIWQLTYVFSSDSVLFLIYSGWCKWLHSSTLSYCCDRNSRAACAQTFAPWQQATTDHARISLIIACSRYIYCGVSLAAHPVRG